MDQPEEILEKLERFNGQKNPAIPRELDEYVSFVARTGDSVFAWPLVKNLYREKLINVITEFYNEHPNKELPTYPNVDPFNYDTMKNTLIEKLDSFIAAPFTIQRISELLSDPRKQYSRIDKFMRAVEKNILVVSTVAPGRHRSEESENGDSLDSALNGEFSSDVHVDIDMDNDGSFTMTKEFNATTVRKEENHEIVQSNHDTITIKKTASKEEEASTSAIATDIVTGESPQNTQTEVSIDSESTVTITVCKPEAKSEESNTSEGEVQSDASEQQKENLLENQEVKVEAPQESIIPEIVETKIEDALLNEPLRPADDEILADTSDLLGTATTPLAALENIVAIRTDPSLIETARNVEQTTGIAQKEDEEADDDDEDDTTEHKETVENENETGTEAKRLKIEEIETKTSEEKEAEVVKEESLEKEDVKATTTEEAQTPSEIVEETVEKPEEPIVEPPILEIPIVEEPIPSEEIPTAVAQTETQMETIPIVPIENTMSLDEDEPPVVAEMEVVPAIASANKMDTDENEAETALMDVDDEPMDQ